MSMFDKIKALASQVAESAVDKATHKVRPELRGVNGLAASFASLVYADNIVEEAEKEAVGEYLIDMDIIREKKLIAEVADMFIDHIEFLDSAAAKGNLQLSVAKGQLLEVIGDAKDDSEWAKVIAETVTMVTSGDGAEEGEIKTRQRILKALNR